MSPLPGAVGISGLSVYDWESADGLCGGSPHMHLVCSEAYVVVGGTGRVQTLTPAGPAHTPLRPGDVVWFTPGTIHRLINEGDLKIVVVMQNSGLPEAGDAVFTFPPHVLADPDAYRKAAELTGDPAEAARRRRDLALEGFLALNEDGLPAFHRAALALKKDLLEDWNRRWREGPLKAAAETGDQLERLALGDPGHLNDAQVHRIPEPEDRKFGMCGRLAVYPVETP